MKFFNTTNKCDTNNTILATLRTSVRHKLILSDYSEYSIEISPPIIL